MAARYTLAFWGMLAAGLVIIFFAQEEYLERLHPTPHEWSFRTRKFLRDSKEFEEPKNGDIQYPAAMGRARNALMRLSDPKKDGAGLVPLSDETDPELIDPIEFVPYDISAKSEEWRRGYFEAIMTVARAAEHVDGWVLDVTRNIVAPAKYMIGPSNPRPLPIPSGSPHAPLEENCVSAYPTADRYYMKILATKGLTPRQRLEAALAYASFMEYKDQSEAARSLQELALTEATKGMDASRLPYDTKTMVLKDTAAHPSLNIIDVLTAIANSKARNGDISGALPMYISLLKTRRGLSDERPQEARVPRKSVPMYQTVIDFFKPPAYPPPPPDGTQPPWRSAEERCQEASLQVYIGEILYATSSKDDGLSWTRDGVDLAEEQLRSIGDSEGTKETKRLCRECLGTGLDNWRTMVSRLAAAEKAKEESGSTQKGMFSFWGTSKEPTDRWAAEEAVVLERVRRTREIMEDITPPNNFITTWFKA